MFLPYRPSRVGEDLESRLHRIREVEREPALSHSMIIRPFDWNYANIMTSSSSNQDDHYLSKLSDDLLTLPVAFSIPPKSKEPSKDLLQRRAKLKLAKKTLSKEAINVQIVEPARIVNVTAKSVEQARIVKEAAKSVLEQKSNVSESSPVSQDLIKKHKELFNDHSADLKPLRSQPLTKKRATCAPRRVHAPSSALKLNPESSGSSMKPAKTVESLRGSQIDKVAKLMDVGQFFVACGRKCIENKSMNELTYNLKTLAAHWEEAGLRFQREKILHTYLT